MTFPLSKTLDPERDYVELAAELEVVDRHFHSASEQHPHRRFEYAMALRALREWGSLPTPSVTYDVGGAGSPLRSMIKIRAIIDSKEPSGWTLADFVQKHPLLADAVFCLSVLEHVDDLDQFLFHLSCLVAPGGLLFLTMDCCNCPAHDADMEISATPDQHHFHWMRQRMFGQADRRYVLEALLDLNLIGLGVRDLTYHGDHVYDYSFCSMAMVKRA